MQRCQTHGIETQIVAILHDVVEDTWITLEMLVRMGFPETIVDAVDAITKREGEDYFTYVERCSRNHIAALVKLADLEDNSDPVRALAGQTRMLERYKRARQIVQHAIEARQAS